MISAFADGALIYDSRLDEMPLLGLTVTESENKAGTASLVLPPDHPYYTRFVGMRTIVEVYEDGDLVFRGRALYPTDDFYRRRTITCEGERGFLNDGIHRPYVYHIAPSAIFRTVIGLYNAEADEEKRFVVGTVEVADDTPLLLESEDAESFNETLDRLVELRGGYVTFTTNADGARCINWVITYGRHVNQHIEIGENLTDYAGADETLDVATVLVPFGALDDTTGQRLTIASVNGGADYIVDDTAKGYRGSIEKAVIFDDVTDPNLLLFRAREHLAKVKNAVTSLQLSAVDLSAIDKTLATFRVGDSVRVISSPHGLDEDFRVTERTRDMLDPAGGLISLGKTRTTLTGLDVEGDRNVVKIINNVRKAYKVNLENAIQQSELTMSSLIEQTSQSILLQVSETYVTGHEVDEKIAGVELTVDGLSTTVENTRGEVSNLSQTVNGFDARISNAEGAVTTLTATVGGLDGRIENAEADVLSLTARADTFDVSLTNANKDIAALTAKADSIELSVNQNTLAISNLGIQLSGYVTFTDLSNAGQTTINGGNITTGTISAINIDGCSIGGGSIYSLASNNTSILISGGKFTLYNASGTAVGGFHIDNLGNVVLSGNPLQIGEAGYNVKFMTNPSVLVGNNFYANIHAGNISNYIGPVNAVFG